MARNSFVGHVGSDGAGMIERALRAGYGYAYIAENVAGGQKSAETAMASWMSSGGHRRNILAPEATQMGVGHAIEGGRAPKYGAYWVIVLGAPAVTLGQGAPAAAQACCTPAPKVAKSLSVASPRRSTSCSPARISV